MSPCLWTLFATIAVATDTLGQQGAVASAESPFPDLVTLSAMPTVESVSELAASCFAKEPPLDAVVFRALLSTAAPVKSSDPSIQQWHYAPWCNVAFRAGGQRYTAQLFLGGRGILTTPSGKNGMFSYTYPLLPKR